MELKNLFDHNFILHYLDVDDLIILCFTSKILRRSISRPFVIDYLSIMTQTPLGSKDLIGYIKAYDSNRVDSYRSIFVDDYLYSIVRLTNDTETLLIYKDLGCNGLINTGDIPRPIDSVALARRNEINFPYHHLTYEHKLEVVRIATFLSDTEALIVIFGNSHNDKHQSISNALLKAVEYDNVIMIIWLSSRYDISSSIWRALKKAIDGDKLEIVILFYHIDNINLKTGITT